MTDKEPKIAPCDECCIKEGDSAKKEVYYCELCGKWFCERHLKPKFPFFIDWDTIFDVQGNREIKLRYHMEYRRKDGHPDFVYWRRTIETFEIEEKKRNEMIKQAIDRMMNPEKYVDLTVDSDSDRKKRVEILKNEERELRKRKQHCEQDIAPDEETKNIGNQETITTGNKYGHRFVVPREVYSNATYREYLDYAKTMKSVKVIVDEYYRKYPMKMDLKKSKNKKHWWNKS